MEEDAIKERLGRHEQMLEGTRGAMLFVTLFKRLKIIEQRLITFTIVLSNAVSGSRRIMSTS